MFNEMLYNLIVQLVQYCWFYCTFDCLARSLLLQRLGWRPSAPLGLVLLLCIIARPSAPLKSTLDSLLCGARMPAPGGSLTRRAQDRTGGGSVGWRGKVSIAVPASRWRRRRRRRRRQQLKVHGQRRLLRWDPQVPRHLCRRKAAPCPTSWSG